MSKSQRRAGGERAGGPETKLEDVVARVHQETPLWQTYLSVHRQIVDRLAEQMLNDHQLPLEWYDVLMNLADVPGHQLRQRELSDRLLLSESGVSRRLARMAKAGLLERTPADDDRRGVAVALTEKGAATLLEATDSHLALVAQLFTDKLTATELIALPQILSKLDTRTD
ncbi:MarR family winged helix-turn-helix transcriptional regulator [Kribbella sp. NPDC051620]|uniref:MarR family winged helix-turn-helix transcriptional regulator n=1 Tax=Kribbella sp. NPDC051620 TaxID=3364120 RepID=UPI0037B5A56B